MTVLLYILCVIQSTNDRDIYIYMYVYIPRKRDRQPNVEVWCIYTYLEQSAIGMVCRYECPPKKNPQPAMCTVILYI